MSQQLLERAEKNRMKYKALEADPKSIYHDDATDESQAHLDKRLRNKCSPQALGLPRKSEHVMAFQCDDTETFCFVGPDANKVKLAMDAWLSARRGPLHSATGTHLKLATFIIPKANKVEDVEGLPRLTFKQNVWNDVHACLEEMKVGVACAPIIHDGLDSTP